MQKNFKLSVFKIFLLIVTLLGLSIIAFWLHQKQPQISVEQKYKSYIQEKILKELALLQQESKEIEELFQENNTITLIEVKKKHRYPCIIFKNEQLIFWSDNHFIPEYELVAGKYSFKYIDTSYGSFIFYRVFFKTSEDNKIEIYTYLPLYTRYRLQNQYLFSQLNPQIFPSQNIKISACSANNFCICTAEGEHLFSIQSTQKQVSHFYLYILGLISLAICFVIVFQLIWQWQKFFLQKQIYEIFIIVFALYWLLIRWLMLNYHHHLFFSEIDLFNPQLYASSFWSPSLGDLFINLLLSLWTLFLLQRNFPKTFIFQKVSTSKHRWLKYVLVGILIFGSYISLYEIFGIFSTIFTNSQIVLDISRNIHFHLSHWIALGIFVMLSVLYFLLLHLIGRLIILFLKNNYPLFTVISSLSTLVHSFVAFYFDAFELAWSFLNGLYLLLLYFFRLPLFLYPFRNVSVLYLLVGALWCATAGTYALRYFSTKTQLQEANRYATNLLEVRDFKVEHSLDDISEYIKTNFTLKSFFKNPQLFAHKNFAEKYIRKQFLRNEFIEYETEIFCFDHTGLPVSKEIPSYEEWWVKNYQKPEFRTNKADRFFINEIQAIEQKIEPNLYKMYIEFVEIQDEKKIIGYVVLTLKQRKKTSFKVYPALLKNEPINQDYSKNNFSYAIFRQINQVEYEFIYSQGECNYYKNFKSSLLSLPTIFSSGYNYQGYWHLAKKEDAPTGRIVVVSTHQYAFKNVFANFALLFLLLVVLLAIILSTYGLIRYYQRKTITLAARIQIVLNLAFFFPLVVFGGFILQLTSKNYENQLNQSFIQKAENASRSLLSILQSYLQEKKHKAELLHNISQVALYMQADLNLFDTTGRLIATTQPNIYEEGLISKNINLEALWAIRERKETTILLAENIGKLNYKVVYQEIRSFEDNKLLAVVNIPFFDAEDERDKKLTEIFTSIINFFTIVFLIFVIALHITSSILTEPLAFITQKIRRITLQKPNEPIEWEVNDEIGLLVNEYNKMLKKLEESKKALAQSEKEAAWREMAKQVAHEIKNPLTPMKITIEHLKRRIHRDFPQLKEITEKPFETLLSQITLLSDIASSFSSFARMRQPESETFDIAQVLKQTLLLYESDEEIQLNSHINEGSFIVKADKQLMMQVFTNLILNAKQSVPNSRHPEILVTLYKTEENKVRIEIRDNGSGIPEEIQHKIFLPNFSTKTTGSGIGLALAKIAIEHAKGKIWFETQQDIGTCFYIELPLEK